MLFGRNNQNKGPSSIELPFEPAFPINEFIRLSRDELEKIHHTYRYSTAFTIDRCRDLGYAWSLK